MLRRLIKDVVPVSRVGVAIWAWHNRDEILAWAGFVVAATPKLVDGQANDVLTEARLRARLTLDKRTRGADGLRVGVSDGVATLHGIVAPEVHDAALEVATATGGIQRVRDDVNVATGPRFGRSRAGFASPPAAP